MKLNEFVTEWKNGQINDAQMAIAFFVYKFSFEYNNPKLDIFLESHSPLEALNNFQFKKVKGKVLECLKNWLGGYWKLKLVTKILTPLEVLEFQAKGIRPVSMLLDTDKPILHRKNPLDFFIHDLEHGYMFFHDQKLYTQQTQFFRNVLSSLETPIWDQLLEDQYFREKFNYLVSDMNSHIDHYRAYLNSIIPRDYEINTNFLFTNVS